MAKSKSSYFLYGMILLSLALGIFLSYLLLFANALFISEIGTSQLPMAYLISGIGGLFITWLFNKYEKKWGFSKAATFFSVIIAVLIFLIWYAYVQNFYAYYVVFFSYAMYWISANFTGLVFWKIPSNIFNLDENKKYNGIISSGEGISAIISYLSVPLLLSLDFFTRDKFLLISFFGILSFAGITFLLSRGIVTKAAPEKVSETKDSGTSDQKKLTKEPYFKLIFLSVLLAVVIQLVIDFCLMEVSANRMSDPLELAKYFSFIFGGMRVIEMNFLPDVYVHCEKCGGKRYNRETLEIRYKGKSISDVLNMTVEEACEFFQAVPFIYRKLKVLLEVGLGYITLGQSAVTLSGGEAQRVKLATELGKKDTGKTFYILDEPTMGLHFQDIQLLIGVLNRLVDRGNTVLVIEHNMDVIKVADHIIDLGPEGGSGGGMIQFVGSPEEMIKKSKTHTAKYLALEMK